MAVTIGGQSLPKEPTTLVEELIQIQQDNSSIGSSTGRSLFGQKKQARLGWAMLSPGDYNTTLNLFLTGSGVVYNNNASNYSGGILTFSGLPFYDEGTYVPGASLYREFNVRIREI